MAAMTARGYTMADMDRMTLGMCFNCIAAADRLTARRMGKKVEDPEVQYRKIKAVQPIVEEKYRKGEISKQRYEDYMRPIWEYERD